MTGGRILGRVRSVLLDLGGVLATGCWPGTAEAWAPLLGMTTQQLAAAVFGGSDDTVLVGRMSEDDWWQQHVRSRLGISETTLVRLRADIAARWSWEEQLLGYVAKLKGRARTAIVSNAWLHARIRLAADGVADLTDAVVLSCGAGVAKPDRRIFELALGRLGAEPGNALFIDDTPGHVSVAQALGMAGHVHTSPQTTTVAIEAIITAGASG
jgi:putative hydrolase of the HAD superfamily